VKNEITTPNHYHPLGGKTKGTRSIYYYTTKKNFFFSSLLYYNYSSSEYEVVQSIIWEIRVCYPRIDLPSTMWFNPRGRGKKIKKCHMKK